jgi:phage virion morphogenesis protein
MTIIRVDVRADETNALLLELQRRTGDIRPAMEGIAQILVSNTQLRFVDQNDPAGNPWVRLSDVTLARRRKNGDGAQILRDTGRLANSINARVEGGSVSLGTNVVYAITHQQGAKKGQYGRSRRGGPIPWGNVPARSFLGYSDQDQADVLELLQRYVDASQPQSWWRRWLDRFRRLF